MLEDAGELEQHARRRHFRPRHAVSRIVKGQIHEDAFHLPLAMRWGNGIKPGRVVEDFVNVRDLAPTYMELAGLRRIRR